jgi:nicotinate-nucleotide--dimethylbenzimidazole phosphoribosyltransferase
MAISHRALIPPTVNPRLEASLRERLEARREYSGSLGELEPLAVRLGLVQNTLRPSFAEARLVVFAADHGLAVDDVGVGIGVGIGPGSSVDAAERVRAGAASRRSTASTVRALLDDRLPLTAFARLEGLDLMVVDAGIAEPVAPHAHLLARKIAHGTRNSRVGPAMSVEHAHAAMRAGMEIGDTLGCSALACAGLGVGSYESAALVLACLSGRELRDFVVSGPSMEPALLEHLLLVLDGARNRHKELADPVEVLAAVGGFEVAMMAGLMLSAGSRRRLIVTDGLAACAALCVASAIAPSLPDYCVHARSTAHRGLDEALDIFGAAALVEVGLDTLDGTGAALAWPLVRHAAAVLGGASEARTNEASIASEPARSASTTSS